MAEEAKTPAKNNQKEFMEKEPVGKILFTEKQIRERARELGRPQGICPDLEYQPPPGDSRYHRSHRQGPGYKGVDTQVKIPCRVQIPSRQLLSWIEAKRLCHRIHHQELH